ncbi:hypothetical protein C8J57DRAFT_77554 [Mycena rebaudengoi]|nr:hypothetical protein C8J57DRAFT_77554 [Mycena rebaudengoi]
MAFSGFDPVTVKEGPITVKKAGLFSSWRGWSERWVVLKATNLTIYKNSVSLDSAIRISLNGITKMERIHISRKGHCLRIEAAGSRYTFAFRSDQDLYNWHDAIYYISPLMLLPATDNTVDLNDIISGYYSNDDPEFSSRPSTPCTLPTLKIPPLGTPSPPALYRPHTHSPASSRQIELDDLRGLRSSPRILPEPMPAMNDALKARERDVIRKAVTLLCNLMEPRLLRKSEPGGEKPVDLVEIRLRSLSRLKRKWGKEQITHQSDLEEMQTFAEALKDGYVLYS